MSVEVPARPRKSVAVAVLGVITLLVGGAYAGFGAFLILAGTGWFVQPGDEPWLPVLFLGRITAIVIGIAFLPLSILGLLDPGGVNGLPREQQVDQFAPGCPFERIRPGGGVPCTST